jgi:hypothetical protein
LKFKVIKKPASVKRRASRWEINSGGVLLSHAVAHVVSSALPALTIEFGMGSRLTVAKKIIHDVGGSYRSIGELASSYDLHEFPPGPRPLSF